MNDERCMTTAGEARDFAPCPFCGGEHQEIFAGRPEIGSPANRVRFRIECGCGGGFSGSCRVYPYENADERVIVAARAEWNSRVAA